jgi:hypothetical protein
LATQSTLGVSAFAGAAVSALASRVDSAVSRTVDSLPGTARVDRKDL